MSDAFAVPGYEVRRLCEDDVADIDALHMRCADFVRLVEGRDPAEGDGLALLHDRPERVPLADKIVFGIYANGDMKGAIELLRNYPTNGIWYLGTLLIDPERRGSGTGASVYAALTKWVAGNGGSAIRLIVQRENPSALRFWLRQGFRVIGALEQQTSARTHTVDQLEQVLAPRGHR